MTMTQLQKSVKEAQYQTLVQMLQEKLLYSDIVYAHGDYKLTAIILTPDYGTFAMVAIVYREGTHPSACDIESISLTPYATSALFTAIRDDTLEQKEIAEKGTRLYDYIIGEYLKVQESGIALQAIKTSEAE